MFTTLTANSSHSRFPSTANRGSAPIGSDHVLAAALLDQRKPLVASPHRRVGVVIPRRLSNRQFTNGPGPQMPNKNFLPRDK